MIRILIADDHPVVRQGLKALIAAQDDMEVVAEVADGEAVLAAAMQQKPDVILMDLMMPNKDGVSATAALLQREPGMRVLVLTSFSDEGKVFAALDAGALGYLLKESPPDQLMRAIREVSAGRSSLDSHAAAAVVGRMRGPRTEPLAVLSRRERQVLQLVGRGLSNQELATQLSLKEHTVAKHVSSILSKLHIENRTQAALLAVRSGLIEDFPDQA